MQTAGGSFLLDDPRVARLFAKIGAELAEDTGTPGGARSGRGDPFGSPAAAKAEVERVEREAYENPKHPLNDQRHPDHNGTHQRMMQPAHGLCPGRGGQGGRMKVTLESTTKLVHVNGVECRIWEGTTEGGIQVAAFITIIGADSGADQSEFQRELQEKEPRLPSARVAGFARHMLF